MKKAVLLGYYGMGNLGDELMLICLRAWLADQGIQATPVAPNAERVRQLHGFEAIQNYPMLGQFSWAEALIRGKALQTLKAVSRSDLVVLGGGDVLRDGIGWRVFSYQIEKLVFALLCRKPVILLNIGISRPVTWYGRTLLRWLLPKCITIVVREQRSLELCTELGAGHRARLLPDIVSELPEFFPSAGTIGNPANIVLAALHGNPNIYGQYSMTDARLQTLAHVLDSIIEEHDLTIHFFPFQCLEGGGDLQIHRDIQSRMRHSGRTVLLDWTIDCAEIARRFCTSRLVIAMRLHAAILAAAYERPCVLMPYDQKVTAFGHQSGNPFSLGAETLDEPTVAKSVLDHALSVQTMSVATDDSKSWRSFVLPQG